MYTLLNCLLRAFSHVPFGVMYLLSDLLYYPLYYVVRYRRDIVRRNLTESFPEKPLSEIVQIEKKFYRFLADTALESVKLMTISDKEVRKRFKAKNIDKINADLDRGASISTFIGHYSNWEWLAALGLYLSKNAVSAQIYHKLRNKAMDKIVLDMRERFGNKCVDMYHTVRFISEELRGGHNVIIGFIADQSPKKREVKDFLPFLNHCVPVLTGTEKITKHFGFQAVFISLRRVKRGYYECDFTPLHPEPSTLPDYELTELYYKRLEQEIREAPEYYLWTHKRFKHARPLTPTDK